MTVCNPKISLVTSLLTQYNTVIWLYWWAFAYWFSGWGTLDFSGPKSNTLQSVNLTVISNTECREKVTNNPIYSTQICTFAPGKDACQSDSGGPLMWVDSNRRLQLVGVISYGLGCATSIPGVNTRVTQYLSWIVSVTSGKYF